MVRKSLFVMTCVCTGFMAIGIVLLVIKGWAFQKILSSNFVILPANKIYPNWVDLPVPILTSIYFFNVTNADDVQKGAKPKLDQVGPFVFREYHHKTKLHWNPSNYTVTYQQIRTWHFDRNETSADLDLDTEIVTLNAPAATVNAMAKTLSPFVQGVLSANFVVINEKLFVRKKVRELLFDGYKDPILTETSILPPSVVPVKMDKFGYFYPRNGSDWFDGVFNMHTGEDGLEKLGQIAMWNYTDQLSYFPGDCGKVRGAGDFFAPGQNETYVELFSNDLKRTLRMDYVEQAVEHGIRGNVYKISDKFFANQTKNPANWCYNPQNEIPSGVFNASSANFGAPIFISQPHFYQADQYYIDQIGSGMNPDQKQHETTFFVEPTTGLPVTVNVRVQLNLLIEPIPKIALFKNLQKTYFPTVWFETKVTLPKEMDTEIWLVSNITHIFGIVGFILLGASLGTVCLIVVFHYAKTARQRQQDANPILNQSLFQEDDEHQNNEEE